MSKELAILEPDTLSELAFNYRQQIFDHHQLGKKSDGELRIVGLNNIRIKRETGQLILAAKANLKADEFKAATDFLTEAEIKGYSRIVKAIELIENPDSGLSEILPMIAAGATLTGSIPMPQGHGPQQLHESNFYSRSIKLTQALMGDINHEIKDRPIESWERDRLVSLAAAIEPLAELYGKLKALIK